MMMTDTRVDPLRRRELEAIFSFDIENALSTTLKKISDRSFNLSVLGVGGGVGAAAQTSAGMDFEKRNELLRAYINSHASHDPYYVIFDSLDEDYKGVLRPDRKEKYFDLLIGLMKAAQNVRRALPQPIKAIPLIFIRDDIFDLCRDPDKNKWLDRSIILNWDVLSLKSLIAFRLSKALDPKNEPQSSTAYGKYISRHLFEECVSIEEPKTHLHICVDQHSVDRGTL